MKTEPIPNDSIHRHRTDVRYRIVDGEGVVLRQEEGEVLVLNEVGARILDLIDGSRTKGDIAALLEEEYEASADTLEKDLQRFLTELEEAGIIEKIETVQNGR